VENVDHSERGQSKRIRGGPQGNTGQKKLPSVGKQKVERKRCRIGSGREKKKETKNWEFDGNVP